MASLDLVATSGYIVEITRSDDYSSYTISAQRTSDRITYPVFKQTGGYLGGLTSASALENTVYAIRNQRELIAIDVSSGQVQSVYTWKSGTINNISDTVDGSLYATKDSRLYKIQPKPDGSYEPIETEISAVSKEFKAYDSRLEGSEVVLYNEKSYLMKTAKYAPDGSLYILASEKKAKAKDPDRLRLFIYNPSTSTGSASKDTESAANQKFIPITPYDNGRDIEYIPVNISSALVRYKDETNWKTYNSAAFIKNTADGAILPLQYNSPFWVNKPNGEFLLNGNIAPSNELVVTKGSLQNGSLSSSYLGPLLPIQPNNQVAQISGTQAVPIGDTGYSLVFKTTADGDIGLVRVVDEQLRILREYTIAPAGSELVDASAIVTRENDKHEVYLIRNGHSKQLDEGNGTSKYLLETTDVDRITLDALTGEISTDSKTLAWPPSKQTRLNRLETPRLEANERTNTISMSFPSLPGMEIELDLQDDWKINGTENFSSSYADANNNSTPSYNYLSGSPYYQDLGVEVLGAAFNWKIPAGIKIPTKEKWPGDGKLGNTEVEFSAYAGLNSLESWNTGKWYSQANLKFKRKVGSDKINSPYNQDGLTPAQVQRNNELAAQKAKQQFEMYGEIANDPKTKVSNQQAALLNTTQKIRQGTITTNEQFIQSYYDLLTSYDNELFDKYQEQASKYTDKIMKIKKDQQELSITANGAFEQEFKQSNNPINETWKAGIELGYKRPMWNIFSNGGIYTYFTLFFNAAWKNKLNSNDPEVSGDLALGNLNLSKVLPLVPLNSNGKQLTPEQLSKLTPEQIGYVVGFDINSLVPETVTDIMVFTNKVTQLAGEFIQYIPPALYITLAMKLAEAAGLKTTNTGIMTPASSVLKDLMISGSEQYAVPDLGMYYPSLEQEDILASSLPVYPDEELQDSQFTFDVGLKEIGVSAEFNLGPMYLDGKLYSGIFYSSKAGKAVVPLGAKVELRIGPLSLNPGIELQWTIGGNKSTNLEDRISNAYQNYLRTEAVGLTGDIELITSNGQYKRSKSTEGEANMADQTQPEFDYLEYYSYGSSYIVWGTWLESIGFGTSKSGGIQRLHVWSGNASQVNGPVVWRDKSVQDFAGFVSGYKVSGVQEPKIGKPNLILEMNAVSTKNSDISNVISALTSPSGYAGSYTLSTSLGKTSVKSGAINSPLVNDSSELGESVAFVSSLNKKALVAISSPGTDFNQGKVSLMRLSNKELGENSTLKNAETNFYSSQKSEKNLRIGESIDSDSSEQPSNKSLSFITVSQNAGDLPNSAVGFVVAYNNNGKDAPTGSIDLVKGIAYDRIRPLYSLYSPIGAAALSVAKIASNVQESITYGTWDASVLQSTISYNNRATGNSAAQLTTNKYSYAASNGYFSLDGTTNYLLTNPALQFSDSGVNKLNTSSAYPNITITAGKSTITALGMTGRVILLDTTEVNKKQMSPQNRVVNGFDYLGLGDKTGRIRNAPKYIRLQSGSGHLILEYNSDIEFEDLNENAISSAVLVGNYTNGLKLDYKSGYEVRSSIQSVSVKDNTVEVTISSDLKLNGNEPYVISASAQRYSPVQVDYADIAFSQLQTPLEVTAVKSFESAKYDISNPGEGKTPWLSISTNNDDGNGMVFLITNENLLTRLITQKKTLYLDAAPNSESLTFKQGVDGFAFKQGNSVSAYTYNNKDYLVITIPHLMSGASRNGAVAFIEYNDKFKQIVKDSASKEIPLLDAVQLIKEKSVTGYLVDGQANSLLGESLQIISNNGEQFAMSGAPGTFSSDAIAKIPGYVRSYILSSEWNASSVTKENELTSRGEAIAYSKLIEARSTNGGSSDSGELQQWLVYSVGKQYTDTSYKNVGNQEVFAYDLRTERKYMISKPFAGNLLDVSAAPNNGIIATFVNTVNGQNYSVISVFSERNGTWLPFTYSGVAQSLSSDLNTALISSDYSTIEKNDISSIHRHVVEGSSYQATISVDTQDEFDYVVIRTQDASALGGRDYEGVMLEVSKNELLEGNGEISFDISTSVQDDYLKSRQLFIITDYFTKEHRHISSDKLPVSIVNQNNEEIRLDRIGIGAQIKGSSLNQNDTVGQSAVSLSIYETPIKGSDNKSNPIAILNSINDQAGLHISSSISLLTYENTNYDISNSNKLSTTLQVDDKLSSLYYLQGSKSYIITRSATATGVTLKTYLLPTQFSELTNNTSFFKQIPTQTQTNSSGTFGSALISFKDVNGIAYLAIGDPGRGLVRVVSESDFLNNSDINSKGIEIKYMPGSSFGTSVSIHNSKANGATLFIGAPKDFSSRELGSDSDFYGGAVFALKTKDLVSNYSGTKTIDLTSPTLSIPVTRLRMTPQIDLNPSSDNYLRATGSAFGTSIASADLYEVKTSAGTIFKTSDQKELVIGAPSTTLSFGSVTGAAYILDTELGLFAPENGLNTITLDQNGFAIGNQTIIRGKIGNKQNNTNIQGVVLYGPYSGDMIGNTVLNLGKFSNSEFDVITLPSPSAIQQAGTVYMYIGNNSQIPLQSSLLNPTSTTDFSYQYVGVSDGINYNASNSSIAAYASNVGRFGEPLNGSQYNGDSFLINSQSPSTQDPKAYLLYGKNYLTPGTTISTSEISAGIGKPFVGNGFPLFVGDANYDGYDDFAQVGGFPQGGRIEFGIPPESTRPYQYFGLDGGDFAQDSYRAVFYKEANSPFVNGALTPINQNHLYYQADYGFPYQNQLYRTDYTPLLNNQVQISRSSQILKNAPYGGLSILNGKFPLLLTIKDKKDFNFNGTLVMPDSGVTKPISNNGFEDLSTYALLGSFIPSLAKPNSGGLATVDDQIKSTLSLYNYSIVDNGGLYSGTGKRLLAVDVAQLSAQAGLDKSFRSSYDSTFTGSFSYGGKQFYSGYSVVINNAQDKNGRKLIYWLYNDTDKMLTGLGHIGMYGTASEMPQWYRALDRRSMIAPVGDFNSDGIPDLAILKDFGNAESSRSNPFTFSVIYGMLEGPNRSLTYRLDNSTSVKPLPNQAGIIFSNAGDYDGTGASTLLVSALEKPKDLQIDGYPIQNQLVSFLLYPTDYSKTKDGIASQQRINGSEGDDQLYITSKDTQKLDELIVSTYQGNDNVSLSADLADQILNKRTFVSLGSGDDSLDVNVKLLRFVGYKNNFSADGGGGTNSLSLSGAYYDEVDLSSLLGRISNFNIINIGRYSVRVDLDSFKKSLLTVKSAEELLPDFSNKYSYYITGIAGTAVNLDISKLNPIQPTTLGFNTFNGYYSPQTNTNFYIQTNLKLGSYSSNMSITSGPNLSPYGILDVSMNLPSPLLDSDLSHQIVKAVDSSGSLLGSATFNKGKASIVLESLPSTGNIRVQADDASSDKTNESNLIADIDLEYAKFHHPLTLESNQLSLTDDLGIYASRLDAGSEVISLGLCAADGSDKKLLVRNAPGSTQSSISSVDQLGIDSNDWLLTEGKFDGGLSTQLTQLKSGLYQPYLLDSQMNTFEPIKQSDNDGTIDYEFANGVRFRLSSDANSLASVTSTDRYTVVVKRLGQLSQSFYFYECDPITGMLSYANNSYLPDDNGYMDAAKSLALQTGTYIDSTRMPRYADQTEYVDIPLKSLDGYGIVAERDQDEVKLSSFSQANPDSSIQFKRLPLGEHGVSYAFEDLLPSENSDSDYNDLIVSIFPNSFNLA